MCGTRGQAAGHVRRCLALLLGLACVLMTGCASKDGELTGEVFIVTKGGRTLRLGLVEVRLIPAEVMTPFVM